MDTSGCHARAHCQLAPGGAVLFPQLHEAIRMVCRPPGSHFPHLNTQRCDWGPTLYLVTSSCPVESSNCAPGCNRAENVGYCHLGHKTKQAYGRQPGSQIPTTDSHEESLYERRTLSPTRIKMTSAAVAIRENYRGVLYKG